MAFFTNGTPLANQVLVKKGITYKEVSLIMGIIVAMVVAFTLWANQTESQTHLPSVSLPEISVPAIGKSIVKIATEIIF
jgi:hypothetical protein